MLEKVNIACKKMKKTQTKEKKKGEKKSSKINWLQRLLVRMQCWYNFTEVLLHKYYATAVSLQSLVLSVLDDSCTNQNFLFRRQVYNRFGVVTSFTSTYRANKWSLELSSSHGNEPVLHLEPSLKWRRPLRCLRDEMSVHFGQRF